MKKIFAGFLICLIASPAFAGAPFDAKTWRGLQTCDVRSLSKNIDSRVGQLVELHFNFRGKDIHHLKPSWYEGSLWQPDAQGKKGFSDVRVMVNSKDLKIFKSLPTDSATGPELTVYGRVLKDNDAHFVFVRLIGRNAVVDPAGNVTVNW